MKKVLLVSYLLSLVSAPAGAVKLCRYNPCPAAIATWKNTGSGLTVSLSNGCFGSSSSASGSGQHCWCRIASSSVNGVSCGGGSWAFLYNSQYNCSSNCKSYSCSGSALVANGSSGIADASTVTCPLSGTCVNTNYKTVGDDESCGTNWFETTGPALTISGEYSNNAGTFTYGECAK